MVERFYIYRSGTSNACALTREKGDSRLPANAWRFWLQASRDQSEDGRFGFNWEAAVTEIAVKGYYLFAGSSRLPAGRTAARPEGPFNV